MSAAGKWMLVIASPLGQQKADVVIAEDLTGTISAMGDSEEIQDGSFEGNTLTFRADVKKPIPISLTFSLTLLGSNLSGQVASGMGKWPVSGSRGSS